MNDDNDIISGFDVNAGEERPFAFDWSTARQLNRGGSTCVAYECTVQRRRVFVKRLKALYRHNPLYRAAFSKEYELGVSLSHPSLPGYFGFGGDYILMDYIEGDTLADLIKRGDSRLANKRFTVKLLNELIDVVEYLHSRNIVHCDIKADNIIISPYHDRPATLIDLDKAYTAWLGDTPGNPANYDCNGCSDGAIDFKGIGLIAGKLGMKRIAKACCDSHVSADSLRAALNRRSTKAGLIPVTTIVICSVIATMSFFSKNTPSSHADLSVDLPEAIVHDTATVADSLPLPTAIQTGATQQAAIDNAWISELIADKSGILNDGKQKLRETLDSDTVPIFDKRMAIIDYTQSLGTAMNEIIFSAVKRYADTSESAVRKAVRSNPGWIRLENENKQVQALTIEWIKVSQHSSDHPVSRPDTTPDEPLRAPHR